MGLFGKSVSNAERAANNLRLMQSAAMTTLAKENAERAQPYADLTPASDIQYPTATGYYLNANPYIDKLAQQTTQNIQDVYNKSYIPSALSSYAGSGRFGSGLFQKTLADTQNQLNEDIGNAINNLYYTNYNQERGYQENALRRLSSQYYPFNRSALLGSIVSGATPYYQILGTPSTKTGNIISGFLGGATAGASAGGLPGVGMGGLFGGILGALA